MTKEEFTARAVKEYRIRHRIPAGWWGTYRDSTDGVHRVRLAGFGVWTLTLLGKKVSQHNSKSGAIRKARSL